MGAPKNVGMRLLFDRRLRLEFRGAKITIDAGLLTVRELDEMMRACHRFQSTVPERVASW
jgi:hypothetical protein